MWLKERERAGSSLLSEITDILLCIYNCLILNTFIEINLLKYMIAAAFFGNLKSWFPVALEHHCLSLHIFLLPASQLFKPPSEQQKVS